MHVIVDGYNAMHALPVGSDWPGRTFKDRREGFIARLGEYAAGRGAKVTVVFDGARGGEAGGGYERRAGVDVLFSPRGVEADRLIRDLVDSSGSRHDLLIVSSDRGVYGYARTRGTSVARADELVRLLRPRAGPGMTPGAVAEVVLKGYRPERRRRPRRASRQALSL
jgi:predicted RNA-binding protein with PIN domain